ncbi:putative DNA glycosylase [Citrus sinensis]|uniref:DNA glycosylase n=1 Tax=Citrus sinensis TaxID=2711 RepID=A0ACB8LRL0_CITSI|nr:putative DNA glycosylase [Citrus sinensis]
MQKSRKRKQVEVTETRQDPYPTHSRPTAEECRGIRDELLALHGFPPEFVKYRNQRLKHNMTRDKNSVPLDMNEYDEGEEESVLDGLVKTVLSQNTTEANSLKAFASLKSTFPTWEHVLAAEQKCIENAIRCGGLAPTKAACIKNILKCLLESKGKLCLEYLRGLSIDEIKAELSRFRGIGPKTVACVLMFHLQQDDFPVDTHVFEISKAIGWVPTAADRNKTYLHLNQRIPKELKFDLNCLLYTHGKLCRNCIKKGGNRQRKESAGNLCPLLNYCEKSNKT